MPRPSHRLIIDARPRGSDGPLAGELVLGRPILAHLFELAAQIELGPVTIHARADEQMQLRSLIPAEAQGKSFFVTGPPPEGSAVLRTDRLYELKRLRRALRRGRDPESAAVWRLDSPIALVSAGDELIRRQSYQPLGRYWALAPARAIAHWLSPTRVTPNMVTLSSFACVLGASAAIANGGGLWSMRATSAVALALALVLDTADGHLARLQGTASEFGRWLDSTLDEVGDMCLHAAVAWAFFLRYSHPGWLLLGVLYASGKYLFFVTMQTAERPPDSAPSTYPGPERSFASRFRAVVRNVGHADVRWHLWIMLAALGRLDLELIAFSAYYPMRALAVGVRKAVARG
jgi:phosphatidylglycerophosphate synthase